MKKEEAITKAREVHGDKYEYYRLPEDVDYKTKYEIFCVKHQEYFSQSLGNHLSNGRGCPTCGFEHVSSIKRERSKKQFLEYILTRTEYTYNIDSYVNKSIPMEITCQIHGMFLQRPECHEKGMGCPKCGRKTAGDKQRLTTESFIEKAKQRHGALYDYSQVNYITQKHKVTIICQEHGRFEQSPNNHLFGNGCPHCVPDKLSAKFSFTTEQFVTKAQSIHQDKLDFSKSVYKNSHHRVLVTCPSHGEFFVKARHILLGIGCSKCGRDRSAAMRSKNQDFYIPLFKEIHKDKYDYSKAVFSASKDKFTVICPKHGEFQSLASNHLKGKGCIKCAAENRGIASRLSIIEVRNRLSDVYGDLYTYPELENEWVDSKSFITISCKQHGNFKQKLHDHLKSETGCPQCNGHANPNLPCWFYIHKVGNGFLKVGITKSFDSRLNSQKLHSQLPVENLFKHLFNNRYDARDLENLILSSYEFGVLPKDIFSDGATETTYFVNYDSITEDVNTFINTLSQ
jgi:hypothetical protein